MNKPERKDYDSLYVYLSDMSKYETYMENKAMAKAAIGIGGAAVAGLVALTVFIRRQLVHCQLQWYPDKLSHSLM